jgi:hypothetical protein
MDIIADSLDIMMCGSGLNPVIQPITITQNGTYTPPAEIDGYSPIVVNVQSISLGMIDETAIMGIAEEI